MARSVAGVQVSSREEPAWKLSFTMSNSEIIWVNRTLAMLARLHHIKTIRSLWTADGGQQYKLTIQTGQRSASTLLSIDSIRAGFRGSEEVQATIVRELSSSMRSLIAAAGSEENRLPSQ
jgi:hypothetical protein